MPAETIKIATRAGGTFDCYLAPPEAGPVPAVVLASAVHGVDPDSRSRRRIRRARLHRGGARSVLALAAGPMTRADKRAGERAQPRPKRSRPAKPTWPIRSPISHAAGVQRPRRRHGLLLRRPLRHDRAEAPGLCRRHFLPRLAHAGLHRRARRRHRAGLHHLGRPGPPGPVGSARRLPRRGGAHEQCRTAHLPRRAARLHDARWPAPLSTPRRANSRLPARWRSSARCAAAGKPCAGRREIRPVRDNTERHRFELDAEGHVAFSNYKRDGGVVTIMHTEVPPALNGKGIGSALVRGAARSRARKGQGRGRYAPSSKAYIARHPEYADLLQFNGNVAPNAIFTLR